MLLSTMPSIASTELPLLLEGRSMPYNQFQTMLPSTLSNHSLTIPVPISSYQSTVVAIVLDYLALIVHSHSWFRVRHLNISKEITLSLLHMKRPCSLPRIENGK